MNPGRVLDVLPAKVAIPLRARFGHRDPEIAHLGRFVHAGDTVFDVGAHKGAYTWHLARLVGAAGEVHAFEPQVDLSERLRRWCPRQVVVHPYALSDQTASASLNVPVWGNTSMKGHASLESSRLSEKNSYQIEVHTQAGDELMLAPSFVKADIEGHEISMLRGAGQTIARCRPVLLLEIDYRHMTETSSRRELVTWLSDHGYSAHYVRRDRLMSFGRLDALTDPNQVLDCESYVYNWFFLPD